MRALTTVSAASLLGEAAPVSPPALETPAQLLAWLEALAEASRARAGSLEDAEEATRWRRAAVEIEKTAELVSDAWAT
jgi:hypothetical protein